MFTRAPLRLAFVAWLLVAVASFASALVQEDVPANDGWVTDRAGMLSAAKEAELETLMESYRNGSGIEIALLTVPGLEGRSIEDLALRTARAWGIGDAEKSQGALLVVARDDRALRIEVGRGLEGNVTDLIAGRIIRNVIVPRFRADDYEGGIEAGIRALHAAAGGDYGPLERADDGGAANSIVLLLFFAFMLFTIYRGHGRGPRSGGGARRRSGFPILIGGNSWGGGGGGGGGFGGFGGGGGFSGGGASGGW